MVIQLGTVDIIMYISGLPIMFICLRLLTMNYLERRLNITEYTVITLLSLFSWLIFALYLIYWLLIAINLIDPDKECKW